MVEKNGSTDKSDVHKATVLVVLVLVLFAYFLTTFLPRNSLHTFSYEDASGQADFSNVMTLPASDWKDNKGQTASAGYTNSTYWIKTKLPSWTDGERLLVLSFPLIEHITLYRLQKHGALLSPETMGAARPFEERRVHSESFVVPLTPDDSEADVLLQVRTQTSMQVPLELWATDEFNIHQRRLSLFHGAYIGVIVAMFLYNLLLYSFIREKAYLWYIGWIACMGLFVNTVNGVAFQWLWPNAPYLNLATLPISLSLATACVVGFFIHFLRDAAQPRPGEWWFRLMGQVSLGVAVTSLLVPYQVGIIAAIGMAMLMVLSIVVAASRRAWQGHTAASYLLLAFSFVFVGAVVLAVSKFGLIPRTFATEYAAEIGSAIEMVVLSLVIVARYNSQIRQREVAQVHLLKTQQRLTAELESRVEARTVELKSANATLLALSQTDALTGVFNRRYLDERLPAELRRIDRAWSSIAVLIIDIDFFKQLNDNHGHQAGDLCLEALAAALVAGSQRPGDMVARYGGEEFMVLAPDISATGADTLAENLRLRVEELLVPVDDTILTMTVSIGLCWRQSGGNLVAHDMVQAADQALYRAKEAGRNQVRKAEPTATREFSGQPLVHPYETATPTNTAKPTQ
jgi:two-component system, sensor histidine kinase LadS